MPNSQREFNKLIRLTKASITYQSISMSVESILMKTGNERTEALRNYYIELFNAVYSSGINFRIDEKNKPTISGFFTDFNQIDGIALRDRVAGSLKLMITEKNPELGASLDKYFGLSEDRRRDIIVEAGKKFTELQDLRRAGMDQKITLLNKIADNILGSAKSSGVHFNPDSTSTYQTNVANLMVMYNERKVIFQNAMESSSRLWRALNWLEIRRTRNFLKKCEEVIKLTAFDFDKHMGPVCERFNSQTLEFVKYQIEMAQDTRRVKQLDEKLDEASIGVEQLTVARDKLEKAQELNKNPATSYITKIQPYINKYGIPIEGALGLPIQHSGYTHAAEKFDRARKTEELQNEINQRFISVMGFVTRGSLEKFGKADPAEILKDTQAIIEIDLKHYTVVYDRPETKLIADEMYSSLSVGIIQRRIINSVKSYYKANGKVFDTDTENELKNAVGKAVEEGREAKRLALEEEKKENLDIINDVDAKTETVDKTEVNDSFRQPLPLTIIEGTGEVELSPIVNDGTKELEKKNLSV